MPKDSKVVYGSLIKDDWAVPEVQFHLHRIETDKSWIGFAVSFPRDSDLEGRHYLSEVHTIIYKFFKGVVVNAKVVGRDDDEHLANLSDINEQEFFHLEFVYEPEHIEVVGYGSYRTSAAILQESYNNLGLIPKSGTLHLFVPAFDQWKTILKNFLVDQLHETDVLESFYHTSKTGKRVPRVQFGQIRFPSKGMTALIERTTFHNYGEYNLIHGNGEYLEYQHKVNLIKMLRKSPVKMATILAYGKDAFFGFLTIPYFSNYQSILHPRNLIEILNQAPPEANEVGKRPKDNAEGYKAKIVSSDLLEAHCNIVVFFIKSKDQSNPERRRDTDIERI
ncbi:MAG: hypothetical protein LQ351_003540 [Letrouitia transgressa]|nr:MAG: hypothetical protein LQ351_003540 [Letrouitia transgressa]